MSLLDKVNGKTVLTAGIVGAVVSSYWLGLHVMAAIAGLMTGVALLTYVGKIQAVVASFFKNHLGDFADVPAWPRYVLLGLAAMTVVGHVGVPAHITMGFLLAAIDGNVFDALY